jgi:hypothetical protein
LYFAFQFTLVSVLLYYAQPQSASKISIYLFLAPAFIRFLDFKWHQKIAFWVLFFLILLGLSSLKFIDEFLVMVALPVLTTAYHLLYKTLIENFKENYTYDFFGALLGTSFYLIFLPLVGAELLLFNLVFIYFLVFFANRKKLFFGLIAGLILNISFVLNPFLNLAFLRQLYDKEMSKAELVASTWSTIAKIDVYKKNGFHELWYNGQPNIRVVKANTPSPINNLKFLFENKRSSLVIGAGGGQEIKFSDELGIKSITAVEVNPGTVRLMQNDLKEVSGDIYSKATVYVDDGRLLLNQLDRYDLIFMPGIEAPHRFSGEYGMYLGTAQAVESLWNKLSDEGQFFYNRFNSTENRQIQINNRLVSTWIQFLKEQGLKIDEHFFAFKTNLAQKRGRTFFLISKKSISASLKKKWIEGLLQNDYYTFPIGYELKSETFLNETDVCINRLMNSLGDCPRAEVFFDSNASQLQLDFYDSRISFFMKEFILFFIFLVLLIWAYFKDHRAYKKNISVFFCTGLIFGILQNYFYFKNYLNSNRIIYAMILSYFLISVGNFLASIVYKKLTMRNIFVLNVVGFLSLVVLLFVRIEHQFWLSAIIFLFVSFTLGLIFPFFFQKTDSIFESNKIFSINALGYAIGVVVAYVINIILGLTILEVFLFIVTLSFLILLKFGLFRKGL